MKKIIFILILLISCTHYIAMAQMQLSARSQYSFTTTNVPTVVDSATLFFNTSRYTPFYSRLQDDYDSLHADSIIQYVVPSFQYINKLEKLFNASNQLIARSYSDKSNPSFYWKYIDKTEYSYDNYGFQNKVIYYNGGNVISNTWNPTKKYEYNYNSSKKPLYTHYATYNYTVLDWEAQDSAIYNWNGNLYGGNIYHNFGNGLEFTNFITSIWAPPYLYYTTYTFRYNSSTNALDSSGKTEVHLLGTNEDSVVQYNFSNSLNTFRVSNANYNGYYPGKNKSHTWRNYVFSLNTINNLIYSQGTLTEFLTVNNSSNYAYPNHTIGGYGMYKIEKFIAYQYPYTKPMPIAIVTNNFDANEVINNITIDSLYYNANDKIEKITSVSTNLLGYKTSYQTLFTYTADEQLQKEALSYYDSTTNAFVYKPGAYVYNYYYGALPNAIGNTNTITNLYKLYPNPATNSLHIVLPANSSNAICTMYDVQGRQVMAKINLRIALNNEAMINISTLHSGQYYLEINDTNVRNIKAFIKQ